MTKRAFFAAVVLLAAVTSASHDPVRHAAKQLEEYFSNITKLTTAPGLGALFADDGVWCPTTGFPCANGAANVTAQAQGFQKGFGLVDAVAKFSDHSVAGSAGSFTYAKSFTCNGKCGIKGCLVPGKSGFEIDADGKITYLRDYVDASDFMRLCQDRCTAC